ncbi:MAG: type II secretion system F family protein [Chloroflexi bacterium]|nr:type II secretion system F family protein [Chloroflexota bacterium]
MGEPNAPLLLGLLLGLATYLVVVTVAVGPDRPALAEWLRRCERRPPGRSAGAVAPERRSPLLDGALGAPLAAGARAALRLADAAGLGQPTRLRQRLALAGHGEPVDHYAQKLGCAAILAVLGLTLLGLAAPLAAVGRGQALPWWVPLALGALGFCLPDLAVGRALRQRQALLRAGLPALLDRLGLHLAAGLGLRAGLDSAVRGGGPLAALLEPALTGARLGGVGLPVGLHSLADDWELAELHTLATLVGLGEARGVAIGAPLARLAEELRADERERRQRAGEAATLKQAIPVATLMLLAFALLLLLPAVDNVLALRPR